METPLVPAGRSVPPGDDFSERDLGLIEVRTRAIGRTLFDHLRQDRPTLLQRRWWDDRIMNWAMSDETLKVELFRFVDVLPMLLDSRAITDHLVEYLERARNQMPALIRAMLGL